MRVLSLFLIILTLLSCSDSSSDSSVVEVVRKKDHLKNRNMIFDFVKEDNHYWIGTQFGLSKVDLEGNILDSYTKEDGLVSDSIYAIAKGSDGKLWLATHNGVSVVDGDKITNIRSEEKLFSNFVNDLVIDGDENLWFATDNGINFFDKSEWKLYKFSDGLPGNYINCIEHDNGVLYFGTDNGIFIKDGDSWVSYTADDGLLDNNILSIYIDSGKIYIGSEAGLSIVEGNDITNYDGSNGFMNLSINDIDILGEQLYLATSLGFVTYDLDTYSTIDDLNGLLHNRCYKISVSDQDIIGSTKKGLVSISGNGEVTNHIYGPTDQIVEFDPESGYLATRYEILKVEDEKWSTLLSVIPLNLSFFKDFVINDNLIFVATENDGFFTIDQNGEKQFYNKDNSPLESNNIYGFSLLDGELWISTSRGGLKFDNGGDWTLYNGDNGLLSKKVYDINLYQDNLAFAGNKGISIEGESEWIYLDDENGLSDRSVWQLIDDQSKLWILNDIKDYVTYYENGELTEVIVDENDPGLWVFDLIIMDEHVVISTNRGIYEYVDGVFVNIYEGENFGEMFSRDYGELYVVENDGLVKFQYLTVDEVIPTK